MSQLLYLNIVILTLGTFKTIGIVSTKLFDNQEVYDLISTIFKMINIIILFTSRDHPAI